MDNYQNDLINRVQDIEDAYTAQTGQKLPNLKATRTMLKSAAAKSLKLEMSAADFVNMALEERPHSYNSASLLTNKAIEIRLQTLRSQYARLATTYPLFANIPVGHIYFALAYEGYWIRRDHARARGVDINVVLKDKFEPIPAWIRVIETGGNDLEINHLFFIELSEELKKYGASLRNFVKDTINRDPEILNKPFRQLF